MNKQLDRITVGIDGEAVTYFIAQTTAPRAYDGFGTFTIYSYDFDEDGRAVSKDGFRMVLIREEHFEWQNGRYNSGLFYAIRPEDVDKQDVVKALWKRFLTAE